MEQHIMEERHDGKKKIMAAEWKEEGTGVLQSPSSI